ncbi:hypothetical protein KKC59_04195 [bacterium]|nr:hypothetical protein [bacterium]
MPLNDEDTKRIEKASQLEQVFAVIQKNAKNLMLMVNLKRDTGDLDGISGVLNKLSGLQEQATLFFKNELQPKPSPNSEATEKKKREKQDNFSNIFNRFNKKITMFVASQNGQNILQQKNMQLGIEKEKILNSELVQKQGQQFTQLTGSDLNLEQREKNIKQAVKLGQVVNPESRKKNDEMLSKSPVLKPEFSVVKIVRNALDKKAKDLLAMGAGKVANEMQDSMNNALEFNKKRISALNPANMLEAAKGNITEGLGSLNPANMLGAAKGNIAGGLSSLNPANMLGAAKENIIGGLNSLNPLNQMKSGLESAQKIGEGIIAPINNFAEKMQAMLGPVMKLAQEIQKAKEGIESMKAQIKELDREDEYLKSEQDEDKEKHEMKDEDSLKEKKENKAEAKQKNGKDEDLDQELDEKDKSSSMYSLKPELTPDE